MRRIAVLLIFILLLTGCQSSDIDEQPTSTVIITKPPEEVEEVVVEEEIQEPEELEEVGIDTSAEEAKYIFLAGDVEVIPKKPYAPTATALPEPYETGEAPSCAFEGLDTLYRYQGFDIQCGRVKGEEVIAGVFFIDETVSTPEGVHIGMEMDDVIDIYGTDFTEEYSKYTYSDGEVDLIFVAEEGKVIAISYLGLFGQ